MDTGAILAALSLSPEDSCIKKGKNRWASYHLPLPEQKDRGSIHNPEDSSHKAGSSHKNVEDSSLRLEELPPQELAKLKAIEDRRHQRLEGHQMIQLTLKTVPSPPVLRDMLEQMAVKELQGPAQGDEEEVSERIRDRYLVGILAPRQRAEDMPLPLFEKPAAPPAEDDDVLEGDFPPGEELGIEGVGRGNLSGDDGPTELSAPMSKAVYPSSLGLSFCVPLETTTLKVTTRWGHYDKNPSEFLVNPKTGTPKRVWKRRPCGGIFHEIPLQAGAVGPIIADESFPDAKIKGLIRRRPDHWSVTLFLVNDGIEPPPPNRERTWMFQCKMAVEAPDGRATAFYFRHMNCGKFGVLLGVP